MTSQELHCGPQLVQLLIELGEDANVPDTQEPHVPSVVLTMNPALHVLQ